MTATRRGILSAFGLSTAAAAINSEAMADREFPNPPGFGGMTRRNLDYQNLVIDALQNMVNSLRNREAYVCGLVITSDANPDRFLDHKIELTIEVPIQPHEVEIDRLMGETEKKHAEAEKALSLAREKLIEAEKQAAETFLKARGDAQKMVNDAHREVVKIMAEATDASHRAAGILDT